MYIFFLSSLLLAVLEVAFLRTSLVKPSTNLSSKFLFKLLAAGDLFVDVVLASISIALPKDCQCSRKNLPCSGNSLLYCRSMKTCLFSCCCFFYLFFLFIFFPSFLLPMIPLLLCHCFSSRLHSFL